MNVINLSKKRFDNLPVLEIPRDVINTEGTLHKLIRHGNVKIVKSLFYNSGQIFANKLYTIEMLNDNRRYLPDYFSIPEDLICVSGNIKGFTIPLIEGDVLTSVLKDKSFSTKEQIYYLKKVGEILNHIANIRMYTPLNKLYLNDMHEANFIVNPNNKQVYVIDLDSCKIGHNISLPSKYLSCGGIFANVPSKYKINDVNMPGYVKAGENTDLYCYNIMILNYLYGRNVNSFSLDDFYDYLNYLADIGIDKGLLDSFNTIVMSKDNINPVNNLDSLTDKQVCLSKCFVYDVVKAKKMVKL